ncbi:hypothetical protein [Streptomyces roseolus]|uniref:hypothetical protein n=1 Tax=Streptomyces roseolus TaxID=67358 RepID=UPI003657DB06
MRDDLGGAIDVAGNAAPDGILGPFREKEASFYTIKDIWSPLQLAEPERFASGLPDGFDGRIRLTNHYTFISTRTCRFTWRLLDFHTPSQRRDGHTVRDQGTATAPALEPGAQEVLRLPRPYGWRRADALALALAPTVTVTDGHELHSWTWTIASATDQARRLVRKGLGPAVRGRLADDRLVLASRHTTVTLDATTGMPAGVTHRGKDFTLSRGPLPTTGTAGLTRLTHGPDGNGYTVEAEHSGVLRHVRWSLHPSGWLQLDYRYHLTGEHRRPLPRRRAAPPPPPPAPRTRRPLLRNAFLRLPTTVLVLASLGFLGLGEQPPTPEWGRLLSENQPYAELAPPDRPRPGLRPDPALRPGRHHHASPRHPPPLNRPPPRQAPAHHGRPPASRPRTRTARPSPASGTSTAVTR